LFSGIIALLLLLIVHEGGHGIVALSSEIPVDSCGLVLFGPLPIGAFVEPDEEKLEKSEVAKKNAVLLAGSGFNAIFAILCFFILLAFHLPFFIAKTLALTIAVNAVVAIVNLLPVPFFDGYHVIAANIDCKTFVDGLAILSGLALLICFIPNFL
jgi:Zn-dependent protease